MVVFGASALFGFRVFKAYGLGYGFKGLRYLVGGGVFRVEGFLGFRV